MKTTQITKSTETQGVNWNAKYYRERANKFYETASYSAPSEPVVIEMGKRDKKALVKAGTAAALKVRHNRVLEVKETVANRVVLVAGVPHKMKDGKLVPMTPAKDSKKWVIVEPKAKKRKK